MWNHMHVGANFQKYPKDQTKLLRLNYFWKRPNFHSSPKKEPRSKPWPKVFAWGLDVCGCRTGKIFNPRGTLLPTRNLIRWINMYFIITTNCLRIFIELMLYRQLTLCVAYYSLLETPIYLEALDLSLYRNWDLLESVTMGSSSLSIADGDTSFPKWSSLIFTVRTMMMMNCQSSHHIF